MNYFEQILLFFVALTANGFSAFAGGGAGLLQLPALIFLGLPFRMALATHKIASVFLGIGATARNSKENTLALRFSLFILLCGLPGVILGANFILKIDDEISRISLGYLTLLLGLYSFFRPRLGLKSQHKRRNPAGYAVGGGVIFLIGILNGSLTSGTGLFVTLWLVSWFGMDYKSAVAYTLVLVGLFWNGSGAVTLAILGDVKWFWLPALIAGSLIGGFTGAHLAIKYGSRWIKRFYETVTITVGIKLIIG